MIRDFLVEPYLASEFTCGRAYLRLAYQAALGYFGAAKP